MTSTPEGMQISFWLEDLGARFTARAYGQRGGLVLGEPPRGRHPAWARIVVEAIAVRTRMARRCSPPSTRDEGFAE